MTRILLSCALLAASLSARTPAPQNQGVTPSASARSLVWSYLHEEKDGAAKRHLQALEKLEGFDDEALDAALKAGPERKPWQRGASRFEFVIPGTKVATVCDLWVPREDPPATGYPLLIAAHGTGGGAEDCVQAWSQSFGWKEFVIAAPTEGADLRGRGWGSSPRERQLHIGLIDLLDRRLPIDRDRVVMNGFSRGGHASWDLGMRYADQFCAIVPVIGGPMLRDTGLLRNLGTLHTWSINGELDQPGLIENVRYAADLLKRLKYRATIELDPQRGHSNFAHRLPDVAKGLLGFRRDPAPKHFEFATLDAEREGRAHYLRVLRLSSKAWKPGKALKIRGVSKMSEERKRAAYREFVSKHSAQLSCRFVQDRFVLKTRGIFRFELFYPARLLEGKKSISVQCNGRTKRVRLGPISAVQQLRLMRKFGTRDPAHRFLGSDVFSGR